jgi:hypothetical protein
MPVRAILTGHSIAVTLSNVVQRLVHLSDGCKPGLRNVAYEDVHPEPRRIARLAPRPLNPNE